MTEHEKRIREALALNITGDKWESDGAGVYSICDSDLEVAVCFTQDSEDAAFIAACNPSAIRALLADLDAMREVLEAIELALKIPGMTGLQILDENSPIRDSIRAALKGASA